jgi:hypothetical protein
MAPTKNANTLAIQRPSSPAPTRSPIASNVEVPDTFSEYIEWLLPTFSEDAASSLAENGRTMLQSLFKLDNSSIAAGESAKISERGQHLHVIMLEQPPKADFGGVNMRLGLDEDAIAIPGTFTTEVEAAGIVVFAVPIKDSRYKGGADNGVVVLSRVLSVVAVDSDLQEVKVSGLATPFVLSLTVELPTNMTAVIDELIELTTNAERDYVDGAAGETVKCLYWDVPNVKWSEEGCKRLGSSLYVDRGQQSEDSPRSFVVRCSCNHLTDFAVGLIMAPVKPTVYEEPDFLDMVTEVIIARVCMCAECV